MSRYIPMPAYYDKMPIDISFVFEEERPAGKHGFLQAAGEEFRFEDGTPARFWGVNFNSGACFPDHDYAEKVASRLAQSGCNIVRFHQMDAEWSTPNIFSFRRGKRLSTTRKFDPRSLDRLDYLIHCLKEEGIYVYLDMSTYRNYKEDDGVVDCEKLVDNGRPYSMTDPKLIELQKEYMTNLWTHYNPYTKLQYKDDPVFVMTEMIAECDLFDHGYLSKKQYSIPEHYDRQYRNVLKSWLEKNNIEYDWENCNLYPVTEKDEVLIRFKTEVTVNFLNDMRAHLRSIGVKIPITGTNWARSTFAHTKSHSGMDYTDSHLYIYDWNWQNNERICKNTSLLATPRITNFGSQATMSAVDKPFFLSEWDLPWPNSFRAEGPIYYAAIGALQGWSGACIHTYSYSTRLDEMKILGRELSSPVAGVPYREGIFSVWNDPAKFGLFYHSALITRRGDVSPANKRIAIKPADPTYVAAPRTLMVDAYEQHRIRMHFGDEKPEGYDALMLDTERLPHPDPKIIMSDNGQVWRKPDIGVGGIDTERTKCFYGKIGDGYKDGSTRHYHRPLHQMNGLEIECATDFGVVALSSLTDEPIETSDNILLSAIGRARNTGAQFDGEKMIDVGHAPIMAEVIDCYVRLKTVHGLDMKVWGVNAEGFYSGKVPTTYEDGWLSFHIGDENNPACYYLIVKE